MWLSINGYENSLATNFVRSTRTHRSYFLPSRFLIDPAISPTLLLYRKPACPLPNAHRVRSYDRRRSVSTRLDCLANFSAVGSGLDLILMHLSLSKELRGVLSRLFLRDPFSEV